MNNNTQSLKWYQNKVIIVPVLIVCGLLGLMAFNSSRKSDASIKIETKTKKEGDSIIGISRKEIEEKYVSEKKKSTKLGQEYLDSLKGKEIEWVGRVEKFDINPINNKKHIMIKMGLLYVKAYDKIETYNSLSKEQLVSLKGKLDTLNELNGVDIYVDPTNITVIK
jgi:hypothetical protein